MEKSITARTLSAVCTLLLGSALGAACGPGPDVDAGPEPDPSPDAAPGDGGGAGGDDDAGPEPEPAPDVTPEEEAAFAQLLQRVELYREQEGVLGVQIAVVTRGELRFSAAVGTGDVDGKRINPETRFRFGSVSKMLVAAALMTAVEDGLLDVDDSVVEHVPGFTLLPPYDPGLLTVRQLLTHSSGLPDGAFECPGDDDELAAYWTGPGELPLWSPPGRLHSYSNPGYNLAGLVLSEVTGQPFSVAIRERLFAPLGMDRIEYSDAAVLADGDYATGYAYGTAYSFPPLAGVFDCGAERPSGTGFGTAEDLARFAVMLLDQGGDVLSPSGVSAMTDDTVPTGTPEAYGYGIGKWSWQGRTLLEHGGAWAGFLSDLLVVPEEGFAVAIIANTYDASPSLLALWGLVDFLGFDIQAPTPWETEATPPSAYASYVGSYLDPHELGAVEVTQTGDQLFATFTDLGGGAIELAYPVLDQFYLLTDRTDVPSSITFFKDGNGQGEYAASRWGVAARVED